MAALDLKKNIHHLIDKIESEQLLITIYDFLNLNDGKKDGALWNNLPNEQKQELLLSFDESEIDSNLIPAERIFKGFK